MLFSLVLATAFARSPEGSAIQALEALDHVTDFQVHNVLHHRAGDRIRVTESYAGLPVYGTSIAVALHPDGWVRKVVGEPLSVAPAATVPVISETHATDVAELLMPGTGRLWPAHTELAYLFDGNDSAYLVWRVSISKQVPEGTWDVFVDAVTGESRWVAPTRFEATGNVYEINPTAGTPVAVTLPDIDANQSNLAGEWSVVKTCDQAQGQGSCQSASHHAVADSSGDFLYAPAAGSSDPFAEVNMFHHLDFVGNWYADMGFSHGTSSGQHPINSFVSMDLAMPNAFYGDADGDNIPDVAFGRNQVNGTWYDFAYDADVIYHEYTHGVHISLVRPSLAIIQADEYGSNPAPSAMGEGLADLMSMAINNDPQVGEYAGLGFGLNGPVRDVEDDKHCPNDIYGGVFTQHQDGEIIGSLGWNLIDHPKLDGDLVAEVTLGAMGLLPANGDFGDLGDAMIETADQMRDQSAMTKDQYDAFVKVVEDHGMRGCERIIDLTDGYTATQQVLGYGENKYALPTQFVLQAPDDAKRLSVTFRAQGAKADIYVRKGEFVWHRIENTQFGPVATPADYDMVYEGISSGETLDITGKDISERGIPYYISVHAYAADGFYLFGNIEVDGEVEGGWVPPEDDKDTDPADSPEDEKGGCGCNTPSAPLAWTPALLLLLGLRRR